MQRITLPNALKVLFAAYAVYAAAVSISALVRHSSMEVTWFLGSGALLWFWAGLAVCRLPVAWGLVRDRKRAWNAAVGLLIFWTGGRGGEHGGNLFCSAAGYLPQELRRAVSAIVRGRSSKAAGCSSWRGALIRLHSAPFQRGLNPGLN